MVTYTPNLPTHYYRVDRDFWEFFIIPRVRPVSFTLFRREAPHFWCFYDFFAYIRNVYNMFRVYTQNSTCFHYISWFSCKILNFVSEFSQYVTFRISSCNFRKCTIIHVYILHFDEFKQIFLVFCILLLTLKSLKIWKCSKLETFTNEQYTNALKSNGSPVRWINSFS